MTKTIDTKHPIGSRIRFVRTLDQPANDETPAQVYAYAGELGQIVGYQSREGYQVKVDRWPNWFDAFGYEFEVVP